MANDSSYDPAAFRAFEHAGWEESAAAYYDSFANVTRQVEAPILEAAGAAGAADAVAGVRLLDVACGPGWLAGAARAAGAEAKGLDFSANMVAEARARHPEVEFQEGDAEALPFEDAAFHAVVCSFGILHFPHPERAAAEAYRVLAPGGRYVLTTWCGAASSPYMALFREAMRLHADPAVSVPGGPPQFDFSDPQSCRGLAKEAGFAECETSEIPVMVRAARPELVLDPVLKGGMRSRALLEAQPPRALANIVAAMAEGARKYERNGAFEIPRPALLVRARKG